MKLYLVRHGETEGNQQHRYVGWEDLALTPAGEAQAAELSDRLRDEPLTAVFSSDLTRAIQTAATLAAPHRLAVQALPGLREANFGAWSGMTYAEIAARDPDRLRAWIDDPEEVAPPGGETLQQLRLRVTAAVPEVNGALIVTHGGPLRALLSLWTGRPFWSFELPPCSLTVVDR